MLPRDIVRTLTNILSDNAARTFIFGAANYLTLPDRPVAAKTGTTNDYHDAWTMGYTPQLATGVWVGNADNTEMSKGADGSVVAAPIWQAYMKAAVANEPVQQFAPPPELPACTKTLVCGSLTSDQKVRINKDNGKLAGPYTPESKIIEVSFAELHDLLHYVTKGDPLGPLPTDPSSDPQYALWEGPVQKWAQSHGYASSTPPTAVDDQYTAADQPTISWATPRDNEAVTSSPLTLSVNVAAQHPISRVDYYIHNQLVGSATQQPWSYRLALTAALPNGSYDARAVITDTNGNEAAAIERITINIPRNIDDWNVAVIDPVANAHYSPVTPLPATIELRLDNATKIKKIDVYVLNGNQTTFIGASSITGQSTLSIQWQPPLVPGTYALHLLVTDSVNTTVALPDTPFTIDS